MCSDHETETLVRQGLTPTGSSPRCSRTPTIEDRQPTPYHSYRSKGEKTTDVTCTSSLDDCKRHSRCSTGSVDSGIDLTSPCEEQAQSQLPGGILKAPPRAPGRLSRRVTFHPNVLLWSAAQCGDFDELFEVLLDTHASLGKPQTTGVSVTDSDRQGITLLHLSSFVGSVKCVRLLITLGGKINAIDKDGWTPLHAASAGGHVDVVHVLVAQGAALEAPDEQGRKPLDVAYNSVTQAALDLYGLSFDDHNIVYTTADGK